MTTIQRTVARTETYTTQETKTGTRSDGMGGTETYSYTEAVERQRTVMETVSEEVPDPIPPAERLLEEVALQALEDDAQPVYGGPAGPTGFIGGNYTDLGIVNDVYDSEHAAQVLDDLLEEGVTEVRVWATGVPGYNMEEDPQRAADRIASLAQLAEARGMTLVVDLFDGQGRSLAELTGPMDEYIDAKIETIVGQNAGFENVRWSLGNELKGHEDPTAFADWFTSKVAAMRTAAGEQTIHVTTQFVPGSAEHRWWADTEDAARRIVESVDSVGVHLYPEGTVAESMDWLEYRSAMEWKRLADAQDKPFIIGEFNVSSVSGARSPEAIDAWLDHLYEQGVDNVSLWQFMKNEGGQLDEEAFDTLRGNDYLDTLRPWLDAPAETAATH
ncbi:MAG: cellulase family glycosylhydrolase [Myxococcales bacterium]|nr:cellulase family glycosylhydrolase [Myxococcales bacterium]